MKSKRENKSRLFHLPDGSVLCLDHVGGVTIRRNDTKTITLVIHFAGHSVEFPVHTNFIAEVHEALIKELE